ncbi:MAG: acyl carrier protein [Acidobacteria bacterium]|nr:MAG: acyl carrier protein [Acidobacteriota bacterium]
MKSLEEVDRQVREVLIRTFNLSREAVTPEATLFQDLDLDSLDAIDLAVKLEIETGLKLAETEFRSIRTVKDVVETIHRKMEARAAE